jgi:hypothetical protein
MMSQAREWMILAKSSLYRAGTLKKKVINFGNKPTGGNRTNRKICEAETGTGGNGENLQVLTVNSEA